MKKIQILLAVAVLLLASGAALAQSGEGSGNRFEVTITNLTYDQIISPPVARTTARAAMPNGSAGQGVDRGGADREPEQEERVGARVPQGQGQDGAARLGPLELQVRLAVDALGAAAQVLVERRRRHAADHLLHGPRR